MADADDLMQLVATLVSYGGYGMGGVIILANLLMEGQYHPWPGATYGASTVMGLGILAISWPIAQWADAPRVACTRCGEKVQPTAKVCKHCGVTFNN